jgi:RNA recognition motif-containing protein
MINFSTQWRFPSPGAVFLSSATPSMSVRLYVGNLPNAFDVKELEALLGGVGEGLRCRGFGFANVDDHNLAEALIAQLNGRDFAGQPLRIEISERRESRNPGPSREERRPGAGAANPARKAVDKVVHADTVEANAPDPRWSSELAKLKALLANQTVGV